MKRLVYMLCAASALTFAIWANAYTPAETRRAYRSCQEFLRLPQSQQKARAERAGYTLAYGLQQCRYMMNRGLNNLLRDEARYNRGDRGGAGRSGGGGNRPECSRSSDCPSSRYQCLGGSCRAIGLDRGCSSGGLDSCPGAETCVAGVCK